MINQITIPNYCIEKIAYFEVSSKAYFNKYLLRPVVPEAFSGITVGIGFDFGYHTQEEIFEAWSDIMSPINMSKLYLIAGLKAEKARAALHYVSAIKFDWDACYYVFENFSLQRSAQSLASVFIGVEKLRYKAQGAMLSLVYNRGAAITGERRFEMGVICKAINRSYVNYDVIALQIRQMKKYWTLPGLISRREWEASEVEDTEEIDYKQITNITF